jgi:hypothetical protein
MEELDEQFHAGQRNCLDKKSALIESMKPCRLQS